MPTKNNKEPQRRYRRRVKLAVFNHYGNNDPKCVVCNEGNIDMLTIEHINDNGQEERKKTGTGSNFYTWLKVNGFPNNGYEIKCFSCNLGRRIDKTIQSQKKLYGNLSKLLVYSIV